jgi:hypothetical protein
VIQKHETAKRVIRKIQDRLIQLETRIDNRIVDALIKREQHAWIEFEDIWVDAGFVEGLVEKYRANGWDCSFESTSIRVTL